MLTQVTSWRNYGIMWAYVIFNIFAAFGLYWLARVVSLFRYYAQDQC